MMYQGNQSKLVQKTSEEVVMNLNILSKTGTNTYDCLIVLNLQPGQDILKLMVQNAACIILADGGANSFYDSSFKNDPKVKVVGGDFDSVRPEVEEYYRNRNVEMCRDDDQNVNDMEKCLLKAKKMGCKSIVCLGALGGRLDHSLSSMHISTKFGREHPDMQVMIVGDNNMMYLLCPHQKYRIHVGDFMEKKGCGLVPFCKADNIETTGFRWNLGKECQFSCLEWGSFISTSNQIVGDQFTVKSSGELFFACSFKKMSGKH